MSAPTTAPPTKLYQALLAAQREMGPVLKNPTNPAFRSKYADLSSVLDTITGPLNAHGVLVLQRLGVSLEPTDLPLLTTELVHAESGQAIECCVRVVSKDPTDPQKFGGALTYYRRYSLLSLLGLAPEDDDVASAIGVDGLQRAQDFADAAGRVFATVKAGLELLNSLKTYKDLPAKAIGELIKAFEGNAASQPARTPTPPQTRSAPRYATEPPPQVNPPHHQPIPPRTSRIARRARTDGRRVQGAL